MQRYFVNRIENNEVFFEKDQMHHILNVMRMHIDQNITCVYQNEVYLCKITSLSPLKVEIVEKLNENHELKNKVCLLYCLPKGDKLDLVIQKACELGVNEIILVQSERCIAKIKKEDEQKKLLRFNTIAKEACEQSKRSFLPEISKIINFKEIKNIHFDHLFIAYENETEKNFYQYLLDVKENESIGILIGAEGGFSEKEVEYAKENGYTSISLGKRILKSETACFYALSAISFMLER